MRIVKEYLYEKFSDDSDPINDLGIGIRTVVMKKIQNLININKEEEGEINIYEIIIRNHSIKLYMSAPLESWIYPYLRKAIKELNLDEFLDVQKISSGVYGSQITAIIPFKQEYKNVFSEKETENINLT